MKGAKKSPGEYQGLDSRYELIVTAEETKKVQQGNEHVVDI